MNDTDKQIYELKAEVFKSLGNSIRLAIFDFIRNKEKCVCEICEFVESSYANVSKHLGIMKNANLIDCRKDGNNIYYFVKMPCALNFNDCINNLIKDNIKNNKKLLARL